jgi:predicted esterase
MEADFATSVVLRSAVRVARAEPGAPLVLALHGQGMTERTFERRLAPAVARGGLSWWVPRGILPCEVRSRRVGYAWYVFDGDQAALRASMDEARAYLVGLAGIARRALRPRSIALLGFSQGGYLASYVALSRPDLFDRLVCCCGRPKAEFVDDLAAARGVEVLVQTGRDDAAVPPDLIAKGVDPLRQAGLAVDVRAYDAGHDLAPEMAADAAAFVLAGA